MEKTIKNVSLIGLGALGVMYSQHLAEKIPYENLRIIADEQRINKYQKEGVYCNGINCSFNYVTPDEEVEAADLLIFAVKYNNLQDAIRSVVNHVGEDTIIISVLNGIVSEADIGEVYGNEHNLYCIAQGMTALKEGNRMTYVKKGKLFFGELNKTYNTEKVERLKTFFDHVEMPYEIDNQMQTKLWSKLMANAGINQTVAYHETTNKNIQKPGKIRDMMVAAMEEVLAVAVCEGVDLSQSDIDYWLKIFDNLEPDGMPSMAQDVKAGRSTEVELFGGTIVKLAQKHGVEVPLNKMFYEYFC